MKTKQIKINVEYDYIIFNGENYEDVKYFVQEHYLYGNSNIDESFHIRPADIPNLDESKLLKWWQSTGDMIMNAEGAILYTHNKNNMPLWKKDELIMIEFKGEEEGYVQREWIHNNDAIIYFNGTHHILSNPTPEGIEELIDTLFHIYNQQNLMNKVEI